MNVQRIEVELFHSAYLFCTLGACFKKIVEVIEEVLHLEHIVNVRMTDDMGGEHKINNGQKLPSFILMRYGVLASVSL